MFDKVSVYYTPCSLKKKKHFALLSRALPQEPSSQASSHSVEAERFFKAIIVALQASPSHLDNYSRAQATNQVCFIISLLNTVSQEGQQESNKRDSMETYPQ